MHDLIIETLIVEEDRSEHIAKHNVSIEEIEEVLSSDYVYKPGKPERWIIIGKTKRQKLLTIILGERPEKNTFGLVTAYPASRQERNFYNKYAILGGEKDEDKKN